MSPLSHFSRLQRAFARARIQLRHEDGVYHVRDDMRENGMNIHRKGATPARDGDLALIPGSMGDHSYVARGLGNDGWLSSCSHGAGRRVRRQEMRARAVRAEPQASWECVTLREERRIEEAPQAYKPIGPVMEAQEEAGLIKAVARLRPWVTFKA